MPKVMSMLAEETGGKSYKAHKYSLDVAERPSLDYGEGTPTIQWKETAETTLLRSYKDISSLCKMIDTENDQILTYFLDGSRRVFKVDDMAYSPSGKRSVIYPIVAGQIGVACCKRVNKRMQAEKYKGEVVLSIPDIANINRKQAFFPAMAKKLNKSEDLKRIGLSFSTILPYKTKKEIDEKYEDLATAKIHARMMENEKELVAELVREDKLNQNNYLIKDGSLEYRPSKEDKADKKKYQTFKNNYNWVLGASKNFNPEICVDVNKKPNPGFIADLPLYHRTPVARYSNSEYFGDIQFAVWYIRLRDKNKTRTPFDGVLKIEKILVTEDEVENGINSSLVDILSAYIINERNPVCYGSDLRWANHIYPVYLTESFVKSKYLSIESFLHIF
ncbi:MAG: hypothetical protein RR413_06455 [Christensenellaceae bacterium]